MRGATILPEPYHQPDNAPDLDRLAGEIRYHIAEGQTSGWAALEHAYEAGVRLRQAKAQLRHGEWETWLAEQFDRSPVWAWTLVRFGDEVDKRQILTTVKISELLAEPVGIKAALKLLRGETVRDKKAPARGDPQTATIYHESALDFLGRWEKGSVDLLLTDPPYATEIDDIAAFVYDWLPAALDLIAETGRAYIFTGAYPRELYAYLGCLLEQTRLHFDQVLVWTYENTLGPAPTFAYKQNWQAIFYLWGQDAPPLLAPELVAQFSVQRINAPDARHEIRLGTWQKPDDLAERFILHSTQPADIVIDPFAGTGTFLAAASRLGRIAYGSEVDMDMISLCQDRGVRYEA